MIFQPISNGEFEIIPESEVDQFYINQFLMLWRNGSAQLMLKSGIMGSEPQNKLVLRPPTSPELIRSPFTF